MLADGLPSAAVLRAPRPLQAPRADDAPFLDRPDADPNQLPAQRWGVVAPTGAEGDRILEALTPLIRLRESEQGARPRVYRVAPGMDAAAAVDWKDRVYRARDVPEPERPRYLMIVGDLGDVSLQLQHTLANGALVGRVHFADESGGADPSGYAAYAAKVVSFASRPAVESSPDLCFYAARDGSPATNAGRALLVEPCLADAEELRRAGHLPAADIREIHAEGTEDLLRALSGARPTVLLSLSHGIGAPPEGWASPEEQRARQGALVLSRRDQLEAGAVRSGPFIPGGIWCCVACFGAGTPTTSVYEPWLADLARVDRGLEGVLHSSAPRVDRPFVAAMPQAALANPEGPLAVIGHMDLAWCYAFCDARSGAGRHARILSTLVALANGSRAGVALDALIRFYRETNDELMASYQAEKDAQFRGRPDPTDAQARAHLWMLRNDLRGYVLLGDPAARLQLRRT